jgi:hypothetical protein
VAFWNTLFRARKNRSADKLPYRVMIISVPKSGTYMYGKLLENFGLSATSLHFSDEGGSYTDYRSASEHQRRAEYTKLEVYKPFAESIWLVNPGQFAVGHLAYTAEIEQTLARANTKIIFTVRDLRAAVVSLMRFQVQAQRTTASDRDWLALPDGPQRTLCFLQTPTCTWFFRIVKRMTPWLTFPNRLQVSFEALYGDYGAQVQLAEVVRIHRYLGLNESLQDCKAALQKTIGANTLTYSGERTVLRNYWDGDVEAGFLAWDGDALQKQYGYASSWSPGSALAG